MRDPRTAMTRPGRPRVAGPERPVARAGSPEHDTPTEGAGKMVNRSSKNPGSSPKGSQSMSNRGSQSPSEESSVSGTPQECPTDRRSSMISSDDEEEE